MTKNNCPEALWPTTLMKAFPSLLVKLLDQKEGESLERLQLVHVDIRLTASESKNPGIWEKVALERSSEGKDHFLTLSGQLKGPDSLLIKVKYFVRGIRKFYKNSVEIEPTQELKAWQNLDREWVIENLKALHQENSALSDEALAELNGRQEVQIPSHLMLGAIIDEALKEWPSDCAPLTHFLVTFLAGISLGAPLDRSVASSSEGVRGAIFSDGQVVTGYQFSCS